MTAFLDTALSVLRLIHIVAAVMMAWPFYALVTVNNRTRLGPPLGDRVDFYMEHIIKSRTIPCYVFQGTALVTGLAIILLRGLGLGTLVTNAALGLKVAFLLLIAALFSYVHLRLQPAIDRLFAQAPTSSIPQEIAAKIQVLRVRRKRIASVCLFSVLMTILLGVQVWAVFPLWLNVILVIAIALFTRRAYASLTPYGWL